MMLEIKPIHQEGVNCGEDTIFMVAKWLNREFELTFANLWVFNFYHEDDKMPGLLGNRIGIPNINLLSLMEKFCGITVNHKEEANSKETLAVVKQELVYGRPTCIYVDTFWCPWHQDYQRISNHHFCLTIGIDSSGNLLCLDQISNEIQTLSEDNFLKGGGSYFIFNIMEKPLIENYYDILTDSVKWTISNGTFDSIKEFINQFESAFNFDLEFHNMETGVWDVLFHRNIGFIAGSRSNYAKFLEFISKKLGFIAPLPHIQEFNTLASKWNMSRSILMKSYYTFYDQNTKAKVINLFKKIVEKEEQIAASLLAIRPEKTVFNVNSVEYFQRNPVDSYNLAYNYLDLAGLFNNNAFGSVISPDCSADITGTGYYFLATDVPSGIISLPDGMSFLFPEVMDGRNNNIFCENQVIPVSGIYSEIMILGCAEYGMFVENLTIEFVDDELVPILIKFTDWAFEPVYGESIAWRGKVVEKRQGKASVIQQMNRIFAKEYQIPKNKVIKNIILPNCPTIHIFAITLCSCN